MKGLTHRGLCHTLVPRDRKECAYIHTHVRIVSLPMECKMVMGGSIIWGHWEPTDGPGVAAEPSRICCCLKQASESPVALLG